MEQNHYAGTFPAALRRFGMVDRHSGQLVGVAVLGAPTSTKVLTNTFPSLEPFTESQELSRFVLLDEVPGNAESWFLARTFAQLRDGGVRGVVAFSDPVPRYSLDGCAVLRGHVGTIYQATNAAYLGRATARTLTLLPDGTVLNDRAAQKVRRQEPGHVYVEERLIAAGAAPMRPGQDPAQWLNLSLSTIGARRLRHAGAHRYGFRLGSARDARRVPFGMVSANPYPKRIDAH